MLSVGFSGALLLRGPFAMGGCPPSHSNYGFERAKETFSILPVNGNCPLSL
jgi:hypothetical protein